MAKYKSKLALEIERHAGVLKTGNVLAIDPSSGSQGSVPGYALFKAGQLQDAGTIALPRGTKALSNRLFLLRDTLEKEFQKPDLLIVELISPVMPAKNGQFLHANGSSLIKAVGAILSCWDVPVLEVAPMTWHSMTPPTYKKSDTHDACMIGWAAFITLARVTGEPEPAPILPLESV
jgi:hypothetical protein